MKDLKKYSFLFIIISVLLVSCTGVSYSFRGGIIPGKTFSISNFPNNAQIVNPNLSFLVFDALRQKVLSESSLKFVNEEGDAHFEGVISGYSISPVQATGNTVAQMSKLTISLKVNYTNKVKPDINFEKSFTDFDTFDNSQDFNAIEEELVISILKKLVDQIYNQSMEDW